MEETEKVFLFWLETKYGRYGKFAKIYIDKCNT